MEDVRDFNAKEFGVRVEQYRKTLNLSQAKVAEQADFTQAYISQIEHGECKTISMKRLLSLANSLNVTVDQLVCDSLIKYENSPNIEQLMSYITHSMDENKLELFSKIVETFRKE